MGRDVVGVRPDWFIRLTLWAIVVVAFGAGLLGIGSVFTNSLLALAVALVAVAITHRWAPELIRYGLSVIWLVVSVLVVERAIAFGVNGWIALGIWLLLSLVATAVYGLTFHSRRLLAESQRTRELAVAEHTRLTDERRRFAQHTGLTYEEAVPALAAGFGRLDQQVPDDFVDAEGHLAPGIAAAMREAPRVERARVVIDHAAQLEAEAVVHAQVNGFPVVVFDLELLNHDVLLDAEQVGHVSDYTVAGALARTYLTVWMVRLPIALPYVASAFAIEEARMTAPVDGRATTPAAEREELANRWSLDLRTGASTWVHDESRWSSSEGAHDMTLPDETLITEHKEYAGRLMSVPAVQASALATDVPPFFVDGDRLVASTMSAHGVDASEVERGMSFITSLARSFPWDELEIHRADTSANQPFRGHRFFRTFRHGRSGTQLERWGEVPTRTGLRRPERIDVAIWSHPYEQLI